MAMYALFLLQETVLLPLPLPPNPCAVHALVSLRVLIFR